MTGRTTPDVRRILPPRRSVWLWRGFMVGLVLLIGALYLGGAARRSGLGFPLDDGWIHQTYARNLAQTGSLVYTGGKASSGSTSPLWTFILSIAYLLHLPPLLWSYLLGGVFWLLTATTVARLARRLYPQQRQLALWVGVACLLEWHLAWASFSGMETTLFTFLSLLVIERYAARTHPAALGLLGGLSFLARPEGAGVVLLVAAAYVVETLRTGYRQGGSGYIVLARGLGSMTAGLAVLVVPYVALNWLVSGQPLPNTFYAKQTEYQALLALPFLARLWRVARRPLVGGQALLLPGFVWAAISIPTDRGQSMDDYGGSHLLVRLLPLTWWAAYTAMYALRMPVDYQYGRYLMPTVPLLLLYGVAGSARWLRPRSARMRDRVLSRALPMAVACSFLAFLVLGQQAYVSDVSLIDCEMVQVGHWLAEETPPDALVAAHDIGAIGYFGQRPLIDLAGLVTPEVIPVMRDEQRLAQFIIDAGADYLVTFPSWYPWIAEQARFAQVYQTDCALTRQRGGDNMVVYAIKRE